MVEMKLHVVCQRQGWEWGEKAGSCLLSGSDRQEETCLAAPFFLWFLKLFFLSLPFSKQIESSLMKAERRQSMTWHLPRDALAASLCLARSKPSLNASSFLSHSWPAGFLQKASSHRWRDLFVRHLGHCRAGGVQCHERPVHENRGRIPVCLRHQQHQVL